jgi:peptidoglycan/xylan/chitin deacetylase (PgdA/CDA1 family)
MVSYWIKTPPWLPRLFPKDLIWKMPAEETPAVYLTFDDGPHPEATPFALEQLKAHKAHATFFCIGRNVAAHNAIYRRIIEEGHVTGNHTQDHLNGWKTDNWSYLNNILKAGRHIESKIYRPPYGRIKISQALRLTKGKQPWKIFMWDVLSGDFDTSLSPEECLDNVLRNIEPGSIIVFHDSEKAYPRMQYVLPQVLSFCKQKNWALKALPTK